MLGGQAVGTFGMANLPVGSLGLGGNQMNKAKLLLIRIATYHFDECRNMDSDTMTQEQVSNIVYLNSSDSHTVNGSGSPHHQLGCLPFMRVHVQEASNLFSIFNHSI